MKNIDVAVVGLGAAGSSAAYHLSKAGFHVLGLDQFHPPHIRGSSHGQSRIIRQAYHESPFYVPLVQEAYREWDALEQASGEQLLLKTGGLVMGYAGSKVVAGARLSAQTHGIPFETLDRKAIQDRFPPFKPTADTVGVLEREAGILFPEKCIKAFLSQAAKRGATLRYDEPVLAVAAKGNAVEIKTTGGTYVAAKAIVCAGPWLNEVMPDLKLPLTIERQVLHWLRIQNKEMQPYFLPGKLPIYICEFVPDQLFYGFPDLGDGIKIANHHAGEPVLPNGLKNAVSVAEINDMVALAERYINIQASFNYAATCMYTNTPDGHFIIDKHPQQPNIIIGSPCSGHGFKFASLTGKLLGNLATGTAIPFDLSPFRISRFAM